MNFRVGVDLVSTRRINRTDVVEKYHQLVNKYLAHSASPISRNTNSNESIIQGVNLDDLWNVYEVLCKTVNFLKSFLFDESLISFLPVPQFNQFENIDKPIICTKYLDHLNKSWHDYEEKIESWNLLNPAQLFNPIPRE